MDCEGPGATQAEMSTKQVATSPLRREGRTRVEPGVTYSVDGESRFWKEVRWPRWTANSNGKGGLEDLEGSLSWKRREAPERSKEQQMRALLMKRRKQGNTTGFLGGVGSRNEGQTRFQAGYRLQAVGCREQGVLPESGDLGNICQRHKVHTSYSPQTHARMFRAALFIIAQTEPPRCSSVNDWINKLWHSHTVGLFQ